MISTNPPLFPGFSPEVFDYVSRCDASTPVQVAVNSPADTPVSVDLQPAQGGSYTTQVTRGVGQEFAIVAQPPSGSPTSYYVRCLPSDFPPWTAQRSGTPQADFYVTATTGYPIIFDTNGVPIWWARSKTSGPFANVLANGDIIWTKSGNQIGPGVGGAGAEEHHVDGTLVQSLNTVAGSNSGDFHDVVILPNGDFLMAAAVQKQHVDLSSWVVNGTPAPSDATIVDYVLQELNPSTNPATVVWSWDVSDHISPTETAQEWRVASPTNNSCCFDVYHYNSIEPTSGGFVASFRHLDAAYKFDPNTTGGPIVWKLGGSARPESLTVKNDPIFTAGGSFAGQHDVRVLSDGSVTLHDNGTNAGRPPRAVHYAIDATSTPPTASLLSEQRDLPLVTLSPCCGSVRLLPGGDWVVGWGGFCCPPSSSAATGTELTSSGARVFLLQFLGANGMNPNIYRFLPVPSGVLTRDALRAGMDAQYP